MRISGSAFMFVLLASGTIASAKPPKDVEAPVSASGEKLVCQNVEELGSRLRSHRECKTKAQWAEERRINREMIDRTQTQRVCGGAMSGC